VGPHVHLELATLTCTVPTPRDLTGVGALPRVRKHMPLEMASLCRTVPTPRDLTGVGVLPSVAQHMRLKSATLCCSVPTSRDLTGVGTLPRVGAHMHLEAVLPCSHIPTPRHATRVTLMSLIHSQCYSKIRWGVYGALLVSSTPSLPTQKSLVVSFCYIVVTYQTHHTQNTPPSGNPPQGFMFPTICGVKVV
jgi:hypothetical protein